MSKIFQDTPTSVIVHPLPKNAKYITYQIEDYLKLTAWMLDNYYHVSQDLSQGNDEFYYNYCEECERNCSDFIYSREDEDGEIDWSEVPGGEEDHCYVYDNGYNGQYCPRGFEKQSDRVEFSVSNMAFQIQLIPNSYVKYADTAFLCGSKVEDGKFLTTDYRLASNVFGTDRHPGAICWGSGNTPPSNLRGIELQFFSTPFNNDLVPLNQFSDNVDYIQDLLDDGMFDTSDNKKPHNLIYNNMSSEVEIDTLIIVDADKHIPAFFTLLTAGFKSIEDAPHMMLIPARETEIEKNGMKFIGYETIPDDTGRKWFISRENNYLVGQI